jgi:hypothetical protein
MNCECFQAVELLFTQNDSIQPITERCCNTKVVLLRGARINVYHFLKNLSVTLWPKSTAVWH